MMWAFASQTDLKPTSIPFHYSIACTCKQKSCSKVMKETNFHLIVTILIFISASLPSMVKSEDHIVGDDEEWNTGINFQSWSQKYNFSVGDVLVFKYLKGQHNAYEVKEETYRSCDGSSGVIAKYETGNDRVQLNQARKYWFVCNVAGHCLGGMRFNVDVKQSDANSTGTTPTSQPVPPPPNSCTRLLSNHIWILGFYIFASGMLFSL